MKKHMELFKKEHNRAMELLEVDDMDLALYGFIGGLQSVMEYSKSDKIAVSEVIRVYKFSVDRRIEEREERERRAKRGVSE